jgi:hypothetical protein
VTRDPNLSKTIIKLITAPAFLGTKFEAYSDRGAGDMLASHDLEDIINVLEAGPACSRRLRMRRRSFVPT